MKVVFMGTPAFAVPALEKLIASEHEIVGVYTKMPKPAGRGFKEVKSAIQRLAEQHDLPVFTPKNFKSEQDIEQLRNLKPDVIVVAAYGLILNKAVLESPKHVCLNIHPSKLPRWRGAAPIQRTIFSGDKDTAVCIMKMDEGLDTGDILLKRNFDLDEKITAYKLHDKCAEIGGDMTLEALDLIEQDKAVFTKQTEEGLVYAEKLTPDDELINFADDVFKISCQIRALSPKPSAYFKFKCEIIKILEADYEKNAHNHRPGEVVDDMMTIAANGGFIKPKLVQRQGKKMIYVDAFLRGFKIEQGDTLN